MKKLISVLLTICMCLSVCCVFACAAETEPLRFGLDGKFTILQISDPQDDHNTAYKLAAFIEKAIAAVQPDLIVITGDLVEDSRAGDIGVDSNGTCEGVTVKGNYEQTLANTKTAIAGIFAPLEHSGIPYAITQGNNDYNSEITNEDWLAIYAEYPGCMVWDESADSEGKIDYYLPILSSDGNAAAFGLWMLDNGRGFTDEQRKWMSDYTTADEPGIVFEHVPTDDIGNLFETCKPWDEGAFANGINCMRLADGVAMGVSAVAHDPGTVTEDFKVWKSKNVVGAFFGHEHTSGYTGTFDGITMGLTYGCQFAKSAPYGMRILELDENAGTFETSLYTYTNGSFSEQIDKPYESYEGTMDKLFASLKNFFLFLLTSISNLFKF